METKTSQTSFSMFSREVSEKTIQKWRAIQIASLLPLIVSIALLFRFKGSIPGTIVFFLLLIVGVLLPQIYRDLAQSHLILRGEIEQLRKDLSKDRV